MVTLDAGPLVLMGKERIMKHRVLLLIVPLLGLLAALSLLPYQVDDAYISYRYAANIAAGLGPVYNPEDPPVEGFTSPLWILLLGAGAAVFGREALPWIGPILGISAYLALLILFLRSRREEPPFPRLLTLGLLALWPGLVFYAATGMEMLLLTLCVLCVHGAAMGLLPGRMGMTAAVLALWIRPEGAWLVVSLFGASLFRSGFRGLFSRSFLRLPFGLVLGGVALLAARWRVFGGFLPNTYYAKTPSWAEGLAYLGDFLIRWPGGLLLILALAGGIRGSLRHRGFLGAGLAWLLAPVVAGGDWMPHQRFLLPAVLLLLLSAGGAFSSSPLWLRRSASVLGLLLLWPLLTGNLEMIRQARISHDHLSVRERTLAEWIKGQGIASVASVDIGVLGFRSDARIVDVVGLTDPVVARSPGGHLTKKFNLDHLFLRLRPEALILRSTIPPRLENDRLSRCRPGSEIEARIFMDNRLLSDYRLIMSLEIRSMPRQSKLLFMRRGHPLAAEGQEVSRQFF